MTWTTAFGDHIIEMHIFSLLDFVLLLCGDISICRKPFARCYVPCGAAKLTSLHPELRSVNDFNFLSTDPRPLSLLCWGEGGQYDEVMRMVVMVMKKVFTMMRMVAMVIETMISVFPANIYNCVFCLFFCGPPGSYWVSTDVYVLTLCMCIIDLPIVLIGSSSEWTWYEVFIIIELR